MFQIEKMTPAMRTQVLRMVEKFYHSNAVSHAVAPEVLEQTFADAVSDDPLLTGYVFTEDGSLVGFAYVTAYYACETGGKCLMFEEIYLEEQARGKGYGSAFIRQVIRERKDVKRFRLEVTAENKDAIALYQSLGFTFLDYQQMVLDV